MSDTNLVSWPMPIPFDSRFRYPILPQRAHLAHPMRNSAPSRLQHIGDFYLLQEIDSLCHSKTRSLTNLLTFDDIRPCSTPMRGDCVCSTLDRLRPHFSGEMLIPSSRTSESVRPSDDKAEETSNGQSESASQGTVDSSGADNDVPATSSDEEQSDIGPLPTASRFRSNSGPQCTYREMRKTLRTLSCEPSTKDLLVKVKESYALAKTKEDNLFFDDSSNSSEHPPVSRSLSDSSCQIKPKLCRRKSVHFADAKGLDLVIKIPFCRELDETDTPPRLLEALAKIRAEMRSNSHVENSVKRNQRGYQGNQPICHYTFVPQFQQPFLEPNFQKRVANQMICLESVSIIPNSHSFTGVIRVMNVEFQKEVTVRITSDNWRSYEDVPACFVASHRVVGQDQFSFHVVAPMTIRNGDRLELALRYQLGLSRREFWDNNVGNNYVINYLEHRSSNTADRLMI